jgi:hypothetical protein
VTPQTSGRAGFAKKKGKKGKCGDDEEEEGDQPNGKCYPLDNDWIFQELGRLSGRDWKELQQIAEKRIKPRGGVGAAGRACIDIMGDVFDELPGNRYRHLGNVFYP